MKERLAVRIILLNAKNHILLVRNRPGCFSLPKGSKALDHPLDQPFWITPGGGAEPGETHHQTLKRELYEETGITQNEILAIHEPPVWYREVILEKNFIPILFKETFYLVRTNSPKVTLDHNPDTVEKEFFLDFRWWSLDELQRSVDIFFPKDIATLLPSLLASPPKKTIMVV